MGHCSVTHAPRKDRGGKEQTRKFSQECGGLSPVPFRRTVWSVASVCWRHWLSCAIRSPMLPPAVCEIIYGDFSTFGTISAPISEG